MACFQAFDKHESGSILWRQFLMENVPQGDVVIRRLKWIFKLLDRSGTNCLQGSVILQILIYLVNIYSIYEKQYPQLEEIIQTFCELYILEGLDPRWIKDTPTLCLLFESGLPLAWVWRGRRLCSRRWTGTMTATSRRRSGWPPASRTRTCAPSSPPTPARRTGARYPISSSLFLLFLLHT